MDRTNRRVIRSNVNVTASRNGKLLTRVQVKVTGPEIYNLPTDVMTDVRHYLALPSPGIKIRAEIRHTVQYIESTVIEDTSE